MNLDVNSRYLKLLKDRINLRQIPFSDRGSRLLIFQSEQHLIVRLDVEEIAEHDRPPMVEIPEYGERLRA